jgi:hypothetical protein
LKVDIARKEKIRLLHQGGRQRQQGLFSQSHEANFEHVQDNFIMSTQYIYHSVTRRHKVLTLRALDHLSGVSNSEVRVQSTIQHPCLITKELPYHDSLGRHINAMRHSRYYLKLRVDTGIPQIQSIRNTLVSKSVTTRSYDVNRRVVFLRMRQQH